MAIALHDRQQRTGPLHADVVSPVVRQSMIAPRPGWTARFPKAMFVQKALRSIELGPLRCLPVSRSMRALACEYGHAFYSPIKLAHASLTDPDVLRSQKSSGQACAAQSSTSTLQALITSMVCMCYIATRSACDIFPGCRQMALDVRLAGQAGSSYEPC